jgi:hypothetical protein
MCLCWSVLTTMWCVTCQDNYPEMDITCLDLSPFYLEKSRDNMDYWRRMRAPASQKISTDKFIQVIDTMMQRLPCYLGVCSNVLLSSAICTNSVDMLYMFAFAGCGRGHACQGQHV